MSVPFRVMTVCTGNICRSPMAEIVLREALKAAGLGDAVVVDSTGISSEEEGNPVDRRARRVLAEHGYPAGDGHRARRVTAGGLSGCDLVLPMTAHHARVLRRIAAQAGVTAQAGPGGEPGATAPAIRMFRTFDPEAPVLGPDDGEELLDVEDPWYGGMEDFEVCLREIEAAVPGIVKAVQERVAAP